MHRHIAVPARAVVAAIAPLALAVTLLAGCTSNDVGSVEVPTAAPTALHATQGSSAALKQPEALGPELRSALAELRAATAPFHSLEAAQAAGWDTRVTGCLSDPSAGGMGFHYADLDRFDTVVEANRPEILVYAPGPNGQLRLVAVEYAVPLSAWTQSEPPSLFGLDYHVNAAFGLWVLHAWVWEPNPAGMFADFNPRVSCAA